MRCCTKKLPLPACVGKERELCVNESIVNQLSEFDDLDVKDEGLACERVVAVEGDHFVVKCGDADVGGAAVFGTDFEHDAFFQFHVRGQLFFADLKYELVVGFAVGFCGRNFDGDGVACGFADNGLFKPAMTMPSPSLNSNGSRPSLESNWLPSSLRVPV